MSPSDPMAMLGAAAGAAGGQVDPKTVVGVAKSAQSPGDAVTQIQAIAHAGNMVKLYDTLKGADPSEQAQGWEGLSPTERESLKSLGYQAPNLDALTHAGAGGQHGGFWSDVISGVESSPLGWALHPTQAPARAVQTVANVPHDIHLPGTGMAERGVGDALNAAGSPLRAAQHLYRAGNAISELGMHDQGQSWQTIAQKSSSGGIDPTEGWSQVLSPSSWAQAWDMTNNGNTTLDPAQNRVLVNKYGQKQVALALQVADQGPDAVVSGAPQAQRQTIINLTQDPKFMDLVSQVGNAKVSVGRLLVGSKFMNDHPAEGKVLSGGIDAAVDVGSDPTMKVGKVSDLLRAAGTTNAAVDREAAYFAKTVAEGGIAKWARMRPQFDPIAPDLAKMNVDSADGFKQYIMSKTGQATMFAGGAAKLADSKAIIPHLTPLGWAKQGMKGVLSNSIDRIADGKADTDLAKIPLGEGEVDGAGEGAAQATQLKNAVDLLSHGKVAAGPGKITGMFNPARQIRRISTLISSKPYITIADASRDESGLATTVGPDVTNFRRYIQGILPTHLTDQMTDLFLKSDEGQRRQLVTAAIDQNFHVLGMYNTDEGRQAAEAWLEAQDNLMRRQAYSVNGYDTETGDDGLPTRNALLETQTSPGMRIPMPQEIRRVVRDAGILGNLGANPVNLADSVMHLWRSAILDRPGFAVRVVLDENGNRVLRMGAKDTIASQFAAGAARSRTDEDIAQQVQDELKEGTIEPQDATARAASLKGLSNKPLLPYHPGERVLRVLATHAPEGLRPHMQNFEQFYGGVFGGAVRRWARQAERKGLKAFGVDRYVAGAENFAKYQPEAADGVLKDIVARGNGDEGHAWSPEAQAQLMRTGGKGLRMNVDKGGNWSPAGIGDPFFHLRWQMALDQIAHSRLGRAALEAIGHDNPTQVDAVKGVIQDPSFANEKKAFVWNSKLQDGRMVGPEATQEQADESWAQQIVDHVNAHVRSGQYSSTQRGPVLQDVVDKMLEHGRTPDIETLEKLDTKQLPAQVVGPEIVPVHKFDSFFKKSFEQMVGRPMNALARTPHFMHQYTDALDDARQIARGAVKSTEDYMAEHKVPVPDTIEHVTRTLNPDEVPESEFYHGTNKAWKDDLVKADDPGAGVANLFGPGLYTTDSKDIALSYIKKGARSSDSKTVYGLRYTGEGTPKMIDLDAPLPPAVKSVIRDRVEQLENDDYSDYAIDDMNHLKQLLADPTAKGSDIYHAFRRVETGERSLSEANEAMTEFAQTLKENGYDGFKHIGGTRAGKGERLHNVNIFFNDYSWTMRDKEGNLTTHQGQMPVEVSHVSTAEKTEEIVKHHPDEVVRQIQARSLDPALVDARREKLASDLAMHRAVNKMIPFIHNPELRTQFEDSHRNLFPFLFAQRQFLQRWARTFADSPEAIRKLQLTMNGLRTSGVVQRDQNGDDFFYYPGSQYVTEMLASTMNRIGVHTTIPFADPFSGDVKYLVPGLSNPVTPSVGPFAAVAMKEGEKIFPEMTGFNQAVLGQGESESPVQQFLPSILNRLYEALGPQEAGSQLMTSSAQYLKYQDAAGHGLPSDATPFQITQFVDRHVNGARGLLLARAALGFLFPATPTANLDPSGLDARYKFLLSVLPYPEATAEFVKEHPGASAYMTGSTQAQTEGGLPSTQADLDWTNQNLKFTENYPAAAPWFAPRSPGTFSLTEFEEQLSTGERQSLPLYDKTPGSKSVVTDIINARASGPYYQHVDAYEKAYSAASGSSQRSQIYNTFHQWQTDFFKRNPIFQEYIASESGHVTRLSTLDDVTKALKDPQLPHSPVVNDIRAVMQTYQNFNHNYASVNGSGSQAYDQRQQVKAEMLDWIASTAKDNPDVNDFLTTIIRPEVDEVTG